jgi:hypothetical protein
MIEWGTVNVWELLWMAILAYGTVESVVNLREAHKDDRARVEKGKNGPLLIVTRQGIRNERLTLVVMAMFSAIGIVALLLPARTAPLRGHVQHLVAHVTPVLTPVAAIGAVAALVYGSRCNRRDRRLIDRWHDEHPLSPPGA